MYLKQLQMFGFKSFPERTSLTFSPGITVVAGPNGSGKSNIVDALLWVLGEQSSKDLRVGRMEDAIFAGNASRKPISYADVSICIDNSDQTLRVPYSEVSIKRSVDRSGVSEYFLNGTSCRLRDLQDLLADTGLGRNAYAIVGQGKVDEVLNQRPEERRYVLEESVGIGRYRWRKRESTQKLAGAERDLERLNDIIAELTLRIDEISPEADRASEYLDIWRALRNLEKEQAQAELIRTRKLLAGITNEIKGNEKRLDELKSKLLKAQDRAEKTKEALAGLEEQQREVLLREGTLKTQLASLEGSLNALGLRSDVRNEIEDREVKTARLKASHERFTEALKVQEEELERLLDEAEKVRALRDESRSALLAVNSELKTKRTDLKDAKTRVVDLLNEKSEIEKNITLASARKESVNRDLQRLRDRRVAATLRLDEAQSRLAQTKETWRGLQERENELRKILEQSEFAVRSQRADLQDLTVSREKERASILALKAKIETLQEMALRQVGFGSGTRAILYGIKNGDLDGSKIFGPLGDLIETSRDYRLALIAGIGGAMDYLVLEDERTARLCIEYLKKRKAGRATFLPLDMVRPSSVSSRELAILDQEGAVGTLVSLITFDSRIEPAVSHIMGRVVVAENLDRAVRLWKRLGFSLRVVTLGGEVVRPGGSMTGGYLAQREKDGSVTGPIGRKAEIEALKKQVGEKEAAFNTLSEQVSAKNTEIENTNRVLEENRSSLKEVSENVLRCKIEIDNSETEIRSIMDELETLEGEEKYIFLSSESEADTGQGPGVEEIKAEIEVIGDKIASLEKETSSLEETAANLQGRLEHLSGEVGRLEEGGASRRQSVLETRTRLEEIDREITDNGEILKRLLDEERKLKENRLQSEEKIRQITAWLEEMQVKSSGMKEEEKRLRGDLASAERECHRLLQQVESCLALLGEKRSAALITEAEVASWRSTLERLISEQGPGVLGSEISAACLDLDIDSSIAGSITSFQDQNPEVFLSRIDELRRRLSSIGPVNLPLIEERKHLVERRRYLKEQYDDLEKSRSSLLSLISEIDREIARTFKESFGKLRESFKYRFKSLFGGGEADLCLVPEDDWVSGGVEIVAKPPGRRVRSLSQLSGGERSLTGIAMIFSMLDCRPCPFVVLDEVEASLDEANATRFVQMLKDLSEQIQFIVVTHKRLTMEAADVIYGITMEEPGASIALSLRL